MKPLVLFIAVVQILGFPVPVLSQEVPYRLDEIVVTAERTKSPLGEAPANVTVITAEEIKESGAQTLVDVFQREPGVFPQNLLGNPKQSNVDIRGFGETAPQNVLFLVDGRRVNNIDFSGADLAQIALGEVERIEVYRGPVSVLFGDNATAGAINIITKKGGGTPQANGAVTVGSYNYFKPEASVSGSQGKFSYYAYASDLETSGYRHNNNFFGKDAIGNVSYDATDFLTLRLRSGTHRDTYGQPGALFLRDLRAGIVDRKDSTHPNDTANTEDSFVDLESEIKPFNDVVLSLAGSYRDRHTSSYNDFGFGSFTQLHGQLQTYAFTPKTVISKPIFNLKSSFVIGTDFYRTPTDVGASGVLVGPSQTNARIEKSDFAYYANERIFPFQNLMLEAGYRRQKSTYDIRFADAVTPELSTTGDARYDKEAHRFAANYSIFDKANVFVSYAQGFRFPTTDELVSQGYCVAPGVCIPTSIDQNLLPQITKEFDAGFRWNPWHRVGGSVTYFSSRTNDEIYFNPLTFMNENYDKTKRQGIETGLYINILEGLDLDLTYSYTEARFDGGPFDRNRIPLVPRNKATAKLSYFYGNWNGNVVATYVGERYAISDQTNSHEQLPGYTTFDTSIGYRYNNLNALLTVKNLTNKYYSEYGAVSLFRNEVGVYPLPGIQVFLRVEYTLGG
jgi:iron complex outermembrane recepter protein